MNTTKPKNNFKKVLVLLGILLVIGVGAVWYIFTEKYTDTAVEKAAYTVTALQLIKEFETNVTAANIKYAEKIVTVNGMITAIENADTTVNIKMADSTTGSYVIFAFQQKDMGRVRLLKAGESTSIKGSCSGGSYSDILEMHFINFKRCTVN